MYEHTSKLRMLIYIYIYYIIMYEHTSKLRMLVNSLFMTGIKVSKRRKYLTISANMSGFV